MHILLKLVTAHPQLLVDHAQSYAELVTADFGGAASTLARRTILGVAAVACLLVACILAGVSLLLWAVVAPAQMVAPWMLLVVPLVPLVASVAALVAMLMQSQVNPFDNLRAQLRADMDMLREGGAP